MFRDIQRQGMIWLVIAVVTWLAMSQGVSGSPTGGQKPNFVFILIDDLGWADIGCYGSQFHETPNVDALAAEGMRFTNGYAACPVCSPTRASILTGKYPARLQFTDWLIDRYVQTGSPILPATFREQLRLEEVTIAEVLKDAGYKTAHVGKWHLGEKPFFPEHQGFDVNIGGNQYGMARSFFYPKWLEKTPVAGQEGDYLTDRLAEEAVKFIEANKDHPFFLYLAHYSVHTPIEARKEMVAKYKAKPKPQGDQDNPVYAAMVESIDRSVGQVTRAMKRLGIDDRTVVMFMSDNGGLAVTESIYRRPTCNAPLRAGKGHLYEGGIREPWIVKWPGAVKPASTCDEPVISIDFFPTIVEMANIKDVKTNGSIDGKSIVPLLKQTGNLQRDAIYWHYPHFCPSGQGRPSGAVRQGDFKLIERYEDGTLELYNLKQDRSETKNLALAIPDKASELRDRLQNWRGSVDAAMPKHNRNYIQISSQTTGAKAEEQGPKVVKAKQSDSAAAPLPVRTQKPNLVFILIDDLGWSDIGCYGSRFYETPNVDALAAEGMRFTDGYAACPVCSPTRASIMTGKYPARLHLTDYLGGRYRRKDSPILPAPFKQQLALEEVTIAEALKSVGYKTGLIGKWHLGREGFLPPNQGFDVNIGTAAVGGPRNYFWPQWRDRVPIVGRQDGEYLTDRLSDEAVQFIEANKDKPFFLYLAHYSVHIPLMAKKELIAKHEKKPKPPENDQSNPVYAAMVESMDQSIGRVTKALERLGLEQQTIVVFMSDNGGSVMRLRIHPNMTVTSNAPLRGGKGQLYEGGIREPWIVKWPGVVEAGSTCDTPVSSVDFFPTLLEIAGVEATTTNGPIDGESIVPLLKKAGGLKRKAIYWHYPHFSPLVLEGRPGGAIRQGDFKLIERYEDGTLELYNLKRDISETHNLAFSMPDKALALRQRLQTWRESVDATMPLPNPNFSRP